MSELSPIHWLIVLAIILLLFGGKKIPEVMNGLGNRWGGGRPGGPQHPIPVTGPVEIKRAAKNSPQQEESPHQRHKAA